MRALAWCGRLREESQSSPARPRPLGARTSGALACTAAVGLIALAACGSSSKPAYCTDRANLENSVKAFSSLSVSSGLSGVRTQAQQLESDATALVSSAKSDFPTETSAITSSIDAFKSALTGLTSSPSAAQIATIAGDASNVVSSVTSFVNATKSKCS